MLPIVIGVAVLSLFGWALSKASQVTKVPLVLSRSDEAKISQLEPETQSAYRRLLSRLANMGIRILTAETARSAAKQAKEFAEGDSASIRSWHEVRRGIDMYPYDPKTGKPDMAGKRIDLYRTMHIEAGRLGFRNIAFNTDGSLRYILTKKGKVWDGGHIQFPGSYKTVAAAARAEPQNVVV